jgi:hypothetical protein
MLARTARGEKSMLRLMRTRWQSIVSVTALVVALLGTTPLGEAAGSALTQVPNFAKRSGTADNAKRLGGRKPSAYAQLDASGKLPVSLFATLPKGDPGQKGDTGAKGEKGDKGDRGPAGLVAAYTKTAGIDSPFRALTTGNTRLVALTLPAGRYLIMAQATIARDVSGNGTQLFAGCRLTAGDEKASVVVAGAKAPGATFATAATNLVHEFSAAGAAEFGCNDATFGESSWSEARITAVQVAATKKAVPGGGVVSGGGTGSG